MVLAGASVGFERGLCKKLPQEVFLKIGEKLGKG